ncbi:hypothetical protein GM182_02370 [bacterium 3DAC]|nr:hypothetical protein [Dictyoglomota bacterium]UZN22773.1 hypothetical protein GM182_02370 [bacterium 3DAC]
MKGKFTLLAVILVSLVFAFVSCGQVSAPQDFSHTFSLKCDYGVHEEGPEAIRLFHDACISPWNTHIYPLMNVNFKEVKYAIAVSTSKTQTATLLVLSTPDGKRWSILHAEKVVVKAPYTTFSGDIKLTTTLTMARAIEFAIDGKRVSPEHPDGVMLIYSEFVLPRYKRPRCTLQNRAIGSLVSTYLYRKVWVHDIGCQVYVEKLPIKVRVINAPATATVYVLTETGTLSRDWQVVGTMSLPSEGIVYTSTFTVNGNVRFVKIQTSQLSDYSWVVTSKIGSKK